MKQDDATEGKCARRGGDGGCLGQGAGCGAPLGREDVAEQVNGAEEHAVAHRVRDDVQPCHARREQAFDEDHEVALHSRVVGGVDAAYKRRGSCARQGVWHARRTCDLATDRPTAVDEGAARGGSAIGRSAPNLPLGHPYTIGLTCVGKPAIAKSCPHDYIDMDMPCVSMRMACNWHV